MAKAKQGVPCSRIAADTRKDGSLQITFSMMASVPIGSVVSVLADDPAAYTDVPSWCTMKAHEFVGHQELPQGGWALYIRRRL